MSFRRRWTFTDRRMAQNALSPVRQIRFARECFGGGLAENLTGDSYEYYNRMNNRLDAPVCSALVLKGGKGASTLMLPEIAKRQGTGVSRIERTLDRYEKLAPLREARRIRIAGKSLRELDGDMLKSMVKLANGEGLGPRQAMVQVAAFKALREAAMDFDPATRPKPGAVTAAVQINHVNGGGGRDGRPMRGAELSRYYAAVMRGEVEPGALSEVDGLVEIAEGVAGRGDGASNNAVETEAEPVHESPEIRSLEK